MPFRTVGWIGLGAMGLPQAGNLLRKLDGLETLVVFDVDSTRASKLPSVEGRKIVNAKSQEDVVEACDAVFTMLPTPKLSLDVYAGFADKIRPGQFILECATVGPKVAKELAGIVEAAGATFIDTPVSGGVQGAEQATLTFIVGTADSPSLEERQKLDLQDLLKFSTPHLDAVRGMLNCMGRNIFHAGPVGAGQVSKLGNNNLIYIHTLALSLSLISGAQHGVPPALLSSIINTSTGRSFMSQHWNPDPNSEPQAKAPATNGYKIPPGFPVHGAVKDISLGHEMGQLVGIENPLVKETLRMFEEAAKGEYAGLDFSSIYKWLRENLEKL